MKQQRSALRRMVGLLGFAAVWMGGDVYAASVRAWLDRSAMQLGETVTLNVEVADNATATQPDFTSLQPDFNLLGTQSSSSMNIVNGAATSKLLWAVGLEPKRTGTLTIPALSVAGAQTQPLTLTVTPASASSGKAGDDVYLDVDVEPKSPYVQQQVQVTVKLYYALSLTDGNLEDPHGPGLNARKLGQDAQYTADVGGRRYRVLERHYVMSAEKSGAATMAPIVFRGHALDPNNANSFFARGRSVTAQAPGTTLDVKPRPANSGTDAWLPAQALTLTAEGIDANTPARVGEPLTLTLHVKAQGLAFEQLPELTLPKIDGAEVYPDKEITGNRDDGTWLHGERTRKFAIVPDRPGALTIPALSLAWWNTAQDRAASADLPALTLDVAAGAASAAASAAPPKSMATDATPSLATATLASPQATTLERAVDTWRTRALAAIALWLATVIAGIGGVLAWRRKAARKPVAAMPDRLGDSGAARAARATFVAACQRDDAAGAAQALLIWARREGRKVRTLGALMSQLASEDQRAALRELERTLYAADIGTFDGTRIGATFGKGFAFAAPIQSGETSMLPPLYPFEVRKRA
ncbi:MAG: protein BatD [Proteobacteria bacterium]|nr:protein BatD [Pseudomonadota bacterium]